MAKKDDPNLALIRELVAAARAQNGAGPTADRDEIVEEGEDLPVASGFDIPRAKQTEDPEDWIVLWCAGCDHSDTDNGRRLIAHFGADLVVLRQEGGTKAAYGVWTGTHWDIANGSQAALGLAQLLGERIGLEAECLRLTNGEAMVIDMAKDALAKDEGDRTEADKARIERAAEIMERFKGRAASRMKWAVSSKNANKLDAMLKCAAPHLVRGPDAFNADHHKVAVRGHTLTFTSGTERVPNPDAERDDAPADAPDTIPHKFARYSAKLGHDRADYITAVVPTAYDASARCPKLTAFLDEFLPDKKVQRLIQVGFGLGLLGITVQKLFFHYGSGANGKSIIMEVICRVLGGAAVTLPAESFFGESGQSGSASPDLARLHNARLLRVQELPEGEMLRVDLVKKLTGGEKIAVRPLFQGYFEFHPIFTAHMSGNGYPKITDMSNGIWRRMTVVHWPVTIAEDRQRNFEDVVAEFEPEHSGILNWLIEGALTYLREGLVIPDEVVAQTKKYRAAMDPTAAFRERCVAPDPGGSVPATEMYEAYVAFAEDSAILPIKQTLFGRIMVKHHEREDGRTRRYLGVKLVDVPERRRKSRGAHTETPDEYPENYGGPAVTEEEE
ncbi:phage/plasmid primase, P4 family [Aureimonas sp. SK2]|uniref:DNA primase family protein n=1 Tax=Aureimonas sp. SK2 TaxID=3015992 RepID=UPI0024441814|nr:phage/plasmid primase, P4 family [Aureimonas sp. SK2]